MATFILGVGAQKAGTTWLHRYLAQAPEFAAGAMKEYHVWDAIYGTDEGESVALEGKGADEREALRRSLISDPELYFEHFRALLGQPGKAIAADITPAYSTLPAEALKRVRDGFLARGDEVKILFLMRDPVERCWSAATMYRRKGLSIGGMDWKDERADIMAYARTEHALGRGRYDRTIDAIEQAVPSSDVFYGFYETLFEPEAVNALSQFLGIQARPELVSSEFNVSPKRGELGAEIRTAVADRYRETLEFCGRRFPQTRNIWSSYLLVG